MNGSFVERQVESAVQEVLGDKASRVMRLVSKLAAKQGAESALENYKLLGKRALIVAGAVIVVGQLTASAVGFVRSRKREEQRIEQVVRRVLAEEREGALE